YDKEDLMASGASSPPTANGAVYLQWAATGVAALQPLLQLDDVKLASTITFVKAADVEHVPLLVPLDCTARDFTRFGSSNPPTNSVFYLRLSSQDATPGTLELGDLRLTGIPGSFGGTFATKTAGNLLTSGDDTEGSFSAGSLTNSATSFCTAVRYAENADSGVAGLDPTDPVYADLPADLYSAGSFGQLGSFDIRLLAFNGKAAGSFVRSTDTTPDVSLVSGGNFAAWAGSEGYLLYFFDQGRDGAFDNEDTPYLVHVADTAAPPATAYPDLLSIRMAGSGGASGTSTGGGGGGGTDPGTDTSTDTTSTSSTGTTTSSTTAGTTSAATTSAESTSVSSSAPAASSSASSSTTGGAIPAPGLLIALAAVAVALALARRRLA
ncbi:MAG TPA: hypothetical protein VHI93_04255, partial [Candidatus Thermoplasmatota archaeon]|nr:hypothetical protein [Candidatus Thermoplasmatota archaeon]